MKKAVLFDLDGTLLNTIVDIADSMNAALARLDLSEHSLEDYKKFVGRGVRTLVMESLPEKLRTDDTIALGVSYFKEDYETNWNNKTTLYPGIEELLIELTAKMIRLAVLSNKPDKYTRIVVDTWFHKWKFDSVRGAREDMPMKPSPAGALVVAAEMSLRPEEILYVGDTGTDMATAVAAGMYPVGVLWGYRSAEELKSAGARKIASHPMEIPGFLEE